MKNVVRDSLSGYPLLDSGYRIAVPHPRTATTNVVFPLVCLSAARRTGTGRRQPCDPQRPTSTRIAFDATTRSRGRLGTGSGCGAVWRAARGRCSAIAHSTTNITALPGICRLKSTIS